MKTSNTLRSQILLLVIFTLSISFAQVGINTTSPHASSSLQLGGNDKGFLMNQVALTSLNSAAPITSPANGLMIFNTATAGTFPNDIYPGYYWWEAANSKWIRMSDDKRSRSFAASYTQSAELRPNKNSGYQNIPGLNNSFTAPYDGTYQFVFSGTYGLSQTRDDNLEDDRGDEVPIHIAFGEGMFRMIINGTNYERPVNSQSYHVDYVSNSNAGESGSADQQYYMITKHVNIIQNVWMSAGTTCNINATFDEWYLTNVNKTGANQDKSFVGDSSYPEYMGSIQVSLVGN